MPEQAIPTPSAPGPSTSTSIDVTAQAITGLAGWANLQRAVNVTFPAQLEQAERLVMNVLRGA